MDRIEKHFCRWTGIGSCLLMLILMAGLLLPTSPVAAIDQPVLPAAPTPWQYSKSKTATNLDQNFCTELTLSLPSAQEELVSDLVFVLDKSSCKAETAEEGQKLLEALKESLGASKAKAKIAVVAFDSQAHTLLPLEDYSGSAEQIDRIKAYMAANSIPEAEKMSGTNMHAGLLEAKRILAADTAVANKRKYMVLVSDGLPRLFTGADGKTKDIYWQTSYKGMSGQAENLQPQDFVYFGMNGEWSEARTNSKNYAWPIVRPACSDWQAYYTQLQQWVLADGDQYALDFAVYGNDPTSKVKNPATGEIIDPDFKFIPYKEFQNHAMSVDRAVYEAYEAYKAMVESNYNCYAVNIGTAPFGKAFMDAMNALSGTPAVNFDQIKKDMLYLVDAGSTVEDYMGFVAGDYNFDLEKAEDMTLTLDNTENGSQDTYPAQKITEHTYGFKRLDDGSYAYTVEYTPGDKGAGEHFVWTMNVPVSNFEHVSLRYKLKLINPKTAPGQYGVYDADGSKGEAGLHTNQMALLKPKDSANVQGAAEAFGRPTVSYTVAGEAPKPTEKENHYYPGVTLVNRPYQPETEPVPAVTVEAKKLPSTGTAESLVWTTLLLAIGVLLLKKH